MKVVYDKKQLKKAAKFLLKQNPYINESETVKSFSSRIKSHLERYAKEVKRDLEKTGAWSYSSTGGYFLLATQDGPKEILIEILVDPAVGDRYDNEDNYKTFSV